jgi:hypothetical protein
LKKKQILFGSIGLICLVVLAGAIYIISKDNIPAVAAEKNNGQMFTSVDIVDQVSNVVTLSPTTIPDKPYIAEIEEVINSKPVGGNDTTPEVIEAPVEDIKVDPVDVSQDDSANVDLKEDTKDNDTEDKNEEITKNTTKEEPSIPKESKKEERVIVDESPKTVKEDKVKEYEGGEKTGDGNSFMDLIPDIDPKDDYNADSDGDVDASGIEVGTWN